MRFLIFPLALALGLMIASPVESTFAIDQCFDRCIEKTVTLKTRQSATPVSNENKAVIKTLCTDQCTAASKAPFEPLSDEDSKKYPDIDRTEFANCIDKYRYTCANAQVRAAISNSKIAQSVKTRTRSKDVNSCMMNYKKDFCIEELTAIKKPAANEAELDEAETETESDESVYDSLSESESSAELDSVDFSSPLQRFRDSQKNRVAVKVSVNY